VRERLDAPAVLDERFAHPAFTHAHAASARVC
jgi:hypothetical protein